MAFTLPPLPYDYNALEPHIDEQTMRIHHDKHHAAYVNNLNTALEGNAELQGLSIEALLGKPSVFDPRAIPAVVFTDPELAWCGITENDAKQQGRQHKVLSFPWQASGRATTERLAGTLPKARRCEFRGLGHMGPVTRPDAVNEAIEGFLEESRRTESIIMRGFRRRPCPATILPFPRPAT